MLPPCTGLSKDKLGLGVNTGVIGSADAANAQIQAFLSSGLLSFDAQAFRVTREEEMLMGIFDPSECSVFVKRV